MEPAPKGASSPMSDAGSIRVKLPQADEVVIPGPMRMSRDHVMAERSHSITGEEDILEEVNLPRLPTSHRTIRASIRRAPEATCEWSYDGSIWTGCAGKHWPSKPERCHECGKPVSWRKEEYDAGIRKVP